MSKSNVLYAHSAREEQSAEPELSVIIPCLNEEETVGRCVKSALSALKHAGIHGEVIVSDNGSGDRSKEIAAKAGARVIHSAERGYGNALLAGIRAARGRFLLMGDADCSYDFAELPKFVEQLRRGADLVQGCRLPSGGGTVTPGAMPFLHRWFGNPFFSMLARRFFGAEIHDVNCGMRAFTAQHFRRLDQRCAGMEFAVEMVLKSSLMGAAVAEVPITLHRDGRVNGRPHLRTFRDGWRTLRFFLICTPLWLFFVPGLFFVVLGGIGYALALPGLSINGVGFDVNTLLVATMFILLGYQSMLFAVSAKQFAISEGLLPEDPQFSRLVRWFSLERGLIAGAIIVAIGCIGIIDILWLWQSLAWGDLDSSVTLRVIVPSVLAICLGVQTVLSSFFLGVLRMQRRRTLS